MDEKRLKDAFLKLDRTSFVPERFKFQAGEDRPLPIGYEQTISQPSLVLEMTRILQPETTHKVLEIGTGSGFQTALLAEMAKAVYSIERIPELQMEAKERLAALGFDNIHYLVGDGSTGWAEQAPFDRIMVTAAATQLPEPLVEQLAPGGRMVIPVGTVYFQALLLITKDAEGRIEEKNLGDVRFVELVGQYGWQH